MQLIRKAASVAAVMAFLASGIAHSAQPPPLPIEPTGIVETLPKDYPEHWFLVHDASFFHMSDGKLYVIDAQAETLAEQVKGFVNVVLMGNILQSARRNEIYATETFHARGTRGQRMDVVTIWDQETLSPLGEVVWPEPKRFMGMPQRYAMLLLDNDRFLAVANFSPATSVTLIDLDSRKIVNEIPTPGCTFTYPTGPLGFSSLCADGRFMSTELAKTAVSKSKRARRHFSALMIRPSMSVPPSSTTWRISRHWPDWFIPLMSAVAWPGWERPGTWCRKRSARRNGVQAGSP